MVIGEEGDGWAVRTLADSSHVEGLAMAAKRWNLEGGARTARRQLHRGERFLYVIHGEGAAVIGGERLRLDPECVVWLEPDDAYSLEAGPRGLEVLEAHAD